MIYGRCYEAISFPKIKMNEPKTETKTLKEIVDARVQSNHEMLITLVDIFKRLEVLEEKIQSSTKI